MCLIPAWAGRKLKITGRLLCGETPSSFCPTDSPPLAGLLTTSVQRWGDLFRAMFPGLGLLMAMFSLLLFNWVHWAILYSKVMHVSYSLISAPSQLTNIFAGKSFYFSFSFSSIPKVESYSVKLGGRSPCRNELLPEPYSRYSWLLSSLQSPSSNVASPGSCLLAIAFQLLPCVSSQVLNGLWPCDWCLSKNMGSLPSLGHHPALTSFPEDFQRASQYEWELPDGGVPRVCLEVGAPILKALCPGLHSVLLTSQALIGKKRLHGWRASQDSWCSRAHPSLVFLISVSASRHDLSYMRCLWSMCLVQSHQQSLVRGTQCLGFSFFKPVSLFFLFFFAN